MATVILVGVMSLAAVAGPITRKASCMRGLAVRSQPLCGREKARQFPSAWRAPRFCRVLSTASRPDRCFAPQTRTWHRASGDGYWLESALVLPERWLLHRIENGGVPTRGRVIVNAAAW